MVKIAEASGSKVDNTVKLELLKKEDEAIKLEKQQVAQQVRKTFFFFFRLRIPYLKFFFLRKKKLHKKKQLLHRQLLNQLSLKRLLYHLKSS